MSLQDKAATSYDEAAIQAGAKKDHRSEKCRLVNGLWKALELAL
jgi:hypothetical protein